SGGSRVRQSLGEREIELRPHPCDFALDLDTLHLRLGLHSPSGEDLRERRLATPIRDECCERALVCKRHHLARVAVAPIPRMLPLVDHDARFRHFRTKFLVSRGARFVALGERHGDFALRLPAGPCNAYVTRGEFLLLFQTHDLRVPCEVAFETRGHESDAIDVRQRGERRIARIAYPTLERDPRCAPAVRELARLVLEQNEHTARAVKLRLARTSCPIQALAAINLELRGFELSARDAGHPLDVMAVEPCERGVARDIDARGNPLRGRT